MGEDGHFASLFPASSPVPGLKGDHLGYVATPPIGLPKVSRITMTRAQILSASMVLLLVSTEEKMRKVHLGLKREDPMNPISYLLHTSHPIHIVLPNEMVVLVSQGAFH